MKAQTKQISKAQNIFNLVATLAFLTVLTFAVIINLI